MKIWFKILKKHSVQLLNFLNEPIDKLKVFIDNYEMHKKKAMGIYKDSKSDGSDIFFHSKNWTPEERREIDAWIEKRYPDIWASFLKDRYSEKLNSIQLQAPSQPIYKECAAVALTVSKKSAQ